MKPLVYNNSKPGLTFKIIIGVFLLIALYGTVVNINFLTKERVYTIGKIYKKTSPGNSGQSFFYYYYFGNKEYRGKFGGMLPFRNNNDLLYLEVAKDDPKRAIVLEFSSVPECLTLEDAPPNGWKELPENPCKK